MSLTQEHKSRTSDWHREDIIAALHKRGATLLGLSREHGYTRNTVRDALDHPYLRCERIIAKALGARPESIWPSRYERRKRRRSSHR